jgi:hypothetical protein
MARGSASGAPERDHHHTLSRSLRSRRRSRQGARLISEPCKQAGHGNVFAEFLPMQAVAGDPQAHRCSGLARKSRGNQANGTPSARPSDSPPTDCPRREHARRPNRRNFVHSASIRSRFASASYRSSLRVLPSKPSL